MAKKDRDAVNRGLEEVLGGTDILGDVISRDRERFGRTEGEADPLPQETPTTQYDNNTSNRVIQQYDTQDILHTDRQTDKQTDSTVIPQQPAPKRPKYLATGGEAEGMNLPERVERAALMTTGSTTTITLRIPAKMNEWLDEYVHRAWPRKVKKNRTWLSRHSKCLSPVGLPQGRP